MIGDIVEEEISIFKYLQVLIRHKVKIAAIFLTGTLLAIPYARSIPDTYKATAVIMPIGTQSGGGLLMNITGLLSGGGSDTAASMAQFLFILKSQTLTENMIKKYRLKPTLLNLSQAKSDSESKDQKIKNSESSLSTANAVKILSGMMSFTPNPEGQVIEISSESGDPEFAAKIVNSYVSELDNHIKENSFTEAKRHRVFVQQQLEQTKIDLLEAGKDIIEFYSTNKVSNTVPAVDVNVALAPGLNLNDKGSSNWLRPKAENEQETPMLKSEELQTRLTEIDSQLENAKIVKDVPQQVYLKYLVLKQELLSQVTSLLSQQYEMAKSEEQRKNFNFEVIDWARIPTKKYKPNRRQIITFAAGTSFLLAVFCAFLLEFLQGMQAGWSHFQKAGKKTTESTTT